MGQDAPGHAQPRLQQAGSPGLFQKAAPPPPSAPRGAYHHGGTEGKAAGTRTVLLPEGTGTSVQETGSPPIGELPRAPPRPDFAPQTLPPAAARAGKGRPLVAMQTSGQAGALPDTQAGPPHPGASPLPTPVPQASADPRAPPGWIELGGLGVVRGEQAGRRARRPGQPPWGWESGRMRAQSAGRAVGSGLGVPGGLSQRKGTWRGSQAQRGEQPTQPCGCVATGTGWGSVGSRSQDLCCRSPLSLLVTPVPFGGGLPFPSGHLGPTEDQVAPRQRPGISDPCPEQLRHVPCRYSIRPAAPGSHKPHVTWSLMAALGVGSAANWPEVPSGWREAHGGVGQALGGGAWPTAQGCGDSLPLAWLLLALRLRPRKGLRPARAGVGAPQSHSFWLLRSAPRAGRWCPCCRDRNESQSAPLAHPACGQPGSDRGGGGWAVRGEPGVPGGPGTTQGWVKATGQHL